MTPDLDPHHAQDDFIITFRALPSAYTPMERVKKLVKDALRIHKLRCLTLDFIPRKTTDERGHDV